MVYELGHFLLIVECGTLTAAARRARLTQPALTASLQRLEGYFGAKLMHRSRKGAELTAAGRALVPTAHAAIALVEDGRRAVAEIEGLRAGEVRLGAGATACTYILPELIARFRSSHPAITVRLREGISEELEEDIESGALDLAIVTGEGGELFFRDSLVLVASPQIDAVGAGFVTFPKGTATRAIVEKQFPNAEIVMELSSIAAVKGNVRAGIGVSLLSESAVADDIKNGRLVTVRSRRTPCRRRLALAHRGVSRLTPAAKAFRALLLEAPSGRKRAGRRARSDR